MMGPERLSLSIPISVGGLPPADRVDRATAAGYRVLESWWPWAEPVPQPDERAAFVGAFRRAGARLELLNLTEGPSTGGGRGIAGIAGDDAGFTRHTTVVIALAAELGARWINALGGNGGDVATLGRRVRELAALGAPHGIGVVLEPLNRDDHPDYLLAPAEVPALVAELRADGTDVALLADVYHLARSGADPAAYVTEHADLIGHIQLADFPGRGRPGSGSIDFAAVLAALDASGYRGMIGLEHLPDGELVTPETAWAELVERVRP